MDTPPEAATVDTRRMLERWATLHAGQIVLGLVATLLSAPNDRNYAPGVVRLATRMDWPHHTRKPKLFNCIQGAKR